MIDKIAVPFWIFLTIGMLIGLNAGHMGFWLLLGAVVGIALGLVLGIRAQRRKKRVFGGAANLPQAPQAPVVPSEPESTKSDLEPAA